MVDYGNLQTKFMQIYESNSRYSVLSPESAIAQMVKDGVLTKAEYDQLIKTSAFGFGFDTSYGDSVSFNGTTNLEMYQYSPSGGIKTGQDLPTFGNIGNSEFINFAELPVNYQIIPGEYTILSEDSYKTFSYFLEIFNTAETTYEQQRANEGFVSDSINAWRELVKAGSTRKDVTSLLARSRSDIELLDAAMRGALVDGNGNDVDFEKAFESIRGVKYSKEKIEECQKKSETYAQASMLHTGMNNLINNLRKYSYGSTDLQYVKEFNKNALQTFKMLGMTTPEQINEALAGIGKNLGTEIAVVKQGTKGKEQYGQSYAIMFKNEDGKFLPLTPEISRTISENLIETIDNTKKVLLGLPLDATDKECEKHIKQLKDEYEESFKEAYGGKDVSILAEQYATIQQKRLMNVNLVANIGLIATSMFTGGATAAVMTGLLMTQPLQALEMFTDENAETNLEAYGKMLLSQLPWMGAGMVMGKLGDLARSFAKLKGLQHLASNSGRSLDDLINIATRAAESGHKLPADLQKAMQITRRIADASGMSVEMALDYAVTKLVYPEGATSQDWIMSFVGALAGSSLNKNISDFAKTKDVRAKQLQETFPDLKISAKEAEMIISKIDEMVGNGEWLKFAQKGVEEGVEVREPQEALAVVTKALQTKSNISDLIPLLKLITSTELKMDGDVRFYDNKNGFMYYLEYDGNGDIIKYEIRKDFNSEFYVLDDSGKFIKVSEDTYFDTRRNVQLNGERDYVIKNPELLPKETRDLILKDENYLFTKESIDMLSSMLKTPEDIAIVNKLLSTKGSEKTHIRIIGDALNLSMQKFSINDIISVLQSEKARNMVLDCIENNRYVKRSVLETLLENGGFEEANKHSFANEVDLSYRTKDITIEAVDNICYKYKTDTKIKEQINSQVPDGEAACINGKMYCRAGDELIPIDLSKSTFDRLFPVEERYNIKQGGLGDCYFISNLAAYASTPNGRGALYSCFREEGNDIYVKFPGNMIEVKFKNGKLNKLAPISIYKLDEKIKVRTSFDQVNASDGIKMIEQAFALVRDYYPDEGFQIVANDYFFMNKHMHNLDGSRLGGASDSEVLGLFKNSETISYYTRYGFTLDGPKNAEEGLNIFANARSEDPNVYGSVYFGKETVIGHDVHLFSKHQYRIENYNPETKMVQLVNPYDASQYIEVPLKIFNRAEPNYSIYRITEPITNAHLEADIKPTKVAQDLVKPKPYDENIPLKEQFPEFYQKLQSQFDETRNLYSWDLKDLLKSYAYNPKLTEYLFFDIGLSPKSVIKIGTLLENGHGEACKKMQESGLFELIKKGKLDEEILKNIGYHSYLSDVVLSDIAKIRDGKSSVTTLPAGTNKSDISKFVASGEVAEIDGKLYANNNGIPVEIKLTKEKFEELFPLVNRFGAKQGETGDCWLVTTLSSLMDSPEGRINLYQLFSQDGDDILVKFPKSKQVVRFKNGQPANVNGKSTSGNKGFMLIEQAYVIERHNKLKLGQRETDVKILEENLGWFDSTIEGGFQEYAVHKITGCNMWKGFGRVIASEFSWKSLTDHENYYREKRIKAFEEFAKDKSKILYVATNTSESNIAESCIISIYDLFSRHAYSVKDYNPNTGIAKISNPWHCEVVTEIPLEVLLDNTCYFGFHNVDGTSARY